MKDRATSYLRSNVTPVVRCGKRLKLVLDEKLKRLIVVIAGKSADEVCRMLSEKFLIRNNSVVKEIRIVRVYSTYLNPDYSELVIEYLAESVIGSILAAKFITL